MNPEQGTFLAELHRFVLRILLCGPLPGLGDSRFAWAHTRC